ncbi:glia maturation factor beta-like [Pollicipes pollicipes]|uniref:glia maturation factor beta-like n=1 Tax=Pollicipes pollicipes TaxID=41117 RepID=UPI001885505B|nr:glia maturation factor beta-like [Pollicipes pollicipes]XP_037090007.1 glia maturation factor beta-like [Pollicipes pollicipes]
MAQNVQICEISSEAKESIKNFRFRKDTTNAALILKVDPESHMVYVDEELNDVQDVDELRAELPEHQPRFIIYSCRMDHSDGRVSYPMVFIFSTPKDAKPQLQMMYAGSKLSLVKEVELTKVYEIRELEELTDEWLVEKLQK